MYISNITFFIMEKMIYANGNFVCVQYSEPTEEEKIGNGTVKQIRLEGTTSNKYTKYLWGSNLL